MRGPDPDSKSNFPEITAMTVWPSIAAYPLGRKVGQLCGISVGIGKFFTVGKLMALATIPVSLALYFWRLAPRMARRYTLTNKRVLIRAGLGGVEVEAVGLDRFDSIEIEVLPGQQFLRAGDLVFRENGKEVFRLAGVQHPEVFRQVCLRGQGAVVAVGCVLAEQSRQMGAPAAAGG